MQTVLVWMLISINTAIGGGQGVVSVIGNFKDEAECQRIKNHIPLPHLRVTKCIQTEIYIPK